MKPSVFVSSTYYDLKYIREELRNFINNYNFEAVLFEEGDVGYTPGNALDTSCYRSITQSDMVLLIIGGRYGSPSSREKMNKDKVFQEYVSVTRKEFRTGIENGIPFFAFVEKAVFNEYEIYEKNIKKFDIDKNIIEFRATSDINVFKFIKEIKEIGNIPINAFEKVNDIEEFLAKQWSDMFKIYLNELKNKTQLDSIRDQVEKMNAMINRMNVIVDLILEEKSGKDQASISKELMEANTKMKISTLASLLSRYVRIDFYDENLLKLYELDYTQKFSEAIGLLCKVAADYAKKEGEAKFYLYDDFFMDYRTRLKEYGMFLKQYPMVYETTNDIIRLCNDIKQNDLIREMKKDNGLMRKVFDLDFKEKLYRTRYVYPERQNVHKPSKTKERLEEK